MNKGTERMLERYWYIAAKTGDLKRQPIAVKLMGRNLVLYRASDNSVAALEDRCLHRNAPLSEGTVCGNFLQCPYHGWKYDGEGNLVEIPSLTNADFDNEVVVKPQLPSYPCVEKQSFIWVCLSDNPVMSSPPDFPYYGEPGWQHFYLTNTFSGSIETCLENFLDCPHAIFVHKGLFRTPSLRNVSCDIKHLEDGAVAEYFEEPREKSLVWWLLTRNNTEMTHTDRYIIPSTSRVDYRFSNKWHYIITSVCVPIGENKTKVYTRIAFNTGFLGPLIKLIFCPLARTIIKQDVDMIKMQKDNIERFGGEAFNYSKADVLLPFIKQWRKELSNGKTVIENKLKSRTVKIRL